MKSVDHTMSIRMTNFMSCVIVQYMGWYLKSAGLVVSVEKDTRKQMLSLGCIHFLRPRANCSCLILMLLVVLGTFG
jgi:hypothetical protein